MRMVDRGPLLTDRLRAQIDQIGAAATRLTEKVDSVLADAKADALDITILPRRPTCLRIQEVAEASQPLAAKKQQSIMVMTPPACPVLCDGERLREVIDNLLSNAIKYSQIGGRIDLALERQHENAVIRVKDQGAGLSPEVCCVSSDASSAFQQSRPAMKSRPGSVFQSSSGSSICITARWWQKARDLAWGATFTVTLPI